MRQLARPFAALVLAGVLPLCALRAQRLTGAVRDSGSAAPLAGAVVVLLDATGGTLTRTLSDANGRYAMMRMASAARLRVIRIGFQPRVVPLPQAGDASITVNVAMTRIPPMLAPVEVTSKALCSEGPDRRRAAAFWEQARAGLLAAVVARDATALAEEVERCFEQALAVGIEHIELHCFLLRLLSVLFEFIDDCLKRFGRFFEFLLRGEQSGELGACLAIFGGELCGQSLQ